MAKLTNQVMKNVVKLRQQTRNKHLSPDTKEYKDAQKFFAPMYDDQHEYWSGGREDRHTSKAFKKQLQRSDRTVELAERYVMPKSNTLRPWAFKIQKDQRAKEKAERQAFAIKFAKKTRKRK